MGRQVIARVECPFCKQEFDVATEDLEWEHQENIGACGEDENILTFSINQKLTCPYCHKDFNVLVNMKGKSEADIDLSTTDVVVMEREAYID